MLHALRRTGAPLVVALLLVASPMLAAPARTITTPKQQFGHDIGDDYFLANYTQFTEYVEEARDRVRSDEARVDRQDGRGARPVHGDHQRAREHQEAGALPRTSPSVWRSPKG